MNHDLKSLIMVRFDDPLAESRRLRIESTLESIQQLLTDTTSLKPKYGLRRYVQTSSQNSIECSSPSAFERAFQRTTDFWNTALQHKSRIAGAVLRTVNDRDKFTELIDALKTLIENLVKLTEDKSISTNQRFIVEYEMEIINDEASLEAIAEASACDNDDDAVSTAARRQLEHTQERSALTQGLLGPGDSASMVSRRPDRPALPTPESNVLEGDYADDVPQIIGIHRVPHDQWRKLKSRAGFLPYLPTLLVSIAPEDGPIRRETTDDVYEDGAPPKEGTNEVYLSNVRSQPTRLAINSKTLLKMLREITGARLTSKQNVLVHPFKLLVLYSSRLRSIYQALCARFLGGSEQEDSYQSQDALDIPTTEGAATSLEIERIITVQTRTEDSIKLKEELECLLIHGR